MAKRLFDFVVALAGLIALGPVMALLALAVKLDSPGPAFYKGRRIGRDGVPFGMYKLRTMAHHADRMGSAVTRGQDPRVTRVGRLLRKSKLDELPQLANVLRGEMSLVGPRPEAPCYVAYYTPQQREALRVRPGITGLAQIHFRNEEALLQGCDDLEREYVTKVMPLKLSFDLEYIRRRSFWLDLRLIWRTAACLCARGDAMQQALPAFAPEAGGIEHPA